MEISVIMLTYNREKLVVRAIESIFAQTFTDFEFIIVDNGSTDKSGDVADGYAAKDSRVKVIRRAKGNIGSGRNAGLDAASGKYITFIDDDDYCEPDCLEFLHGLAEDNEAGAAICGAADKAFDEKRVMTAEEALITLFWRQKYNVAFPAKLFDRKLFEGVRFSEASKYDDIELMPRILGSAGRVAYHGLPKYTFFRHEDNNSAWTTDHSKLDANTLDEYLRVYRERTKWLCVNFPANAEYWKYFEWSFMISMVEKITRLRLDDCRRQREDMASVLLENREAFMAYPAAQGFEKEWMKQYI